MSRILIEYMPMLTIKTETAIKQIVTPSMTSEDGDTSQYEINTVLEALTEEGISEDLEIIKGFINEGVNYIEI